MQNGNFGLLQIWFTTSAPSTLNWRARKARSLPVAILAILLPAPIHVELKTVGLQKLLALPESALESLGILEVRLVTKDTELASIRLVTDVRWSSNEWQRGVLDPFR